MAPEPPRSSSSGVRAVALAVAAGCTFALVGPPTDVYVAPWVAMAVLAWVLGDDPPGRRSRGPRLSRALAGAGRGLAFGFGANLVFVRFVPAAIVRFTPLGLAGGLLCQALVAAAQGLSWAIAGLVAVQLGRRGVPRWIAFGIGVFASTFAPVVFLWSPASLVSPVPPLIQLAELVGGRGVSLLMGLSAGLLGEGLARIRSGPARARAVTLGAGVALPLLTYAEGDQAMARVERARESVAHATVALVQPSIEAVERWDPSRAPALLDGLGALTRSAEADGAELTVWSEGAYPYPLVHEARVAPPGRTFLPAGVRGPVLSGYLTLGPGRDQHNSAAVFRADGSISVPEDKIHLLAFGERIPIVGGIPWVRRTFARSLGLVPGTEVVVQTAGGVRAAVLICVEDILPEAGREAMAARPNLLVNLTNDAWFSGTEESELHLRLAIARAVESRRDMVRAVNLGPTSWVDAAGVVRARYGGDAPGVLKVEPALLEGGPTLYDRLGDWPLALLSAVVAGVAWAIRSRSGSAPPA